MKIENLKLNYGCAFHDDKHLLSIVSDILVESDYFIETGSWEGDSTGFVADNFPNIVCATCEPDLGRYTTTVNALKHFKNVHTYNICSPEIFQKIPELDQNMYNKTCTFWLDAHGWGFKWPLKEEIAFITKNFKKCYILIDDFKNPYVPQMEYHQYEGQYCTWDYIKGDVVNSQDFEVWYPTYTQHTSRCNGLVGWTVITNIKDDILSKHLRK